MTRVVVTGIGIVSCFGAGLETFEDAVFSGKSGVRKIENFDCSELPCRIAAELTDYNPSKYLALKLVRRYDRFIVASVAATKMAVEDSKLVITSGNSARTGVYIGSGIGGLDTFVKETRVLYEKGARRMSPFFIPNVVTNMASGVVAMEVGAEGPNFSIVSACSSSSHAIGEAFRALKYGAVDAILAGGSECAANVLGVGGFCAMKAVTTSWNDDPERASRPFDSQRDGFVLGEGAVTLVLESLVHARARGAPILAEIVGYGASADAFHITAPSPDGRGAQAAMRLCLADAGIEPEDIGYINAHGTSTPLNDKVETQAIKSVFGSHAHVLSVSSTKSVHGHLLGAAGAIEAAAVIFALNRQEIPPTINYENSDPDCDLDYTPNEAKKKELKYALSNSFGFGGQNCVLIFKKWEE